METETSELTKVFHVQSSGSGGGFEMQILMNINRDFTNTDKSNIRHIAAQMENLIRQETLKLNPKSAADAAEERRGLMEVFDGREIFVEEIPNGYCSEWCCKHLPWFVVTTRLGRITIGWRKRVIQIDWKDSKITKTAMELFENEDVTKGDTYIHAWGYEKAKEYMQKLLTNA
jgi:hypothetical protein